MDKKRMSQRRCSKRMVTVLTGKTDSESARRPMAFEKIQERLGFFCKHFRHLYENGKTIVDKLPSFSEKGFALVFITFYVVTSFPEKSSSMQTR